jgi:hypothetical protein
MAQETQYWSFRYILGTEYSAKTEASEISRMAADSTMLRMVNRLMAFMMLLVWMLRSRDRESRVER